VCETVPKSQPAGSRLPQQISVVPLWIRRTLRDTIPGHRSMLPGLARGATKFPVHGASSRLRTGPRAGRSGSAGRSELAAGRSPCRRSPQSSRSIGLTVTRKLAVIVRRPLAMNAGRTVGASRAVLDILSGMALKSGPPP